jgi:hypothetical protein
MPGTFEIRLLQLPQYLLIFHIIPPNSSSVNQAASPPIAR